MTLHFPGEDWAHADPEAAGIAPTALERATETIFSIEERYGFLVSVDGQIVHEHYVEGPESTNRIFSLTKGLGATLVGVAVEKGLLSVDDHVANWLPVRHPDIVEDARILHLLNMSAHAEPAGSGWAYNSAKILNSLPGILWHASGIPPVEFYDRYLRARIGFSFDWPANEHGWIQIGSRGPLPVIEATHRDIARLGLLWMNRGEWNGDVVMPADYVEAGLRAPHAQVNSAYGYLWWLNRADGRWRTTGKRSGTGRWFPDAPERMFLGLGARGKVLVVLPEERVVAVTMGDTPQEQSANYLETIVGAVMSLV